MLGRVPKMHQEKATKTRNGDTSDIDIPSVPLPTPYDGLGGYPRNSHVRPRRTFFGATRKRF